MLKAYKCRLYPNKEQQGLFMKYIGACRFTYNWALENKIRTCETEKTY
ncbi:MAG: helix-turn-helix domain-containing protein [Methanosarcinaceae archaeon]|nr:helix-turn-helix domain-containing protein [Methanosarcinaceae archaeon]